MNGTEVYRGENGNVSLVSRSDLTFSPGPEDVNRHFVVLSGLFSASAVSTGPVPIINGATGTTIKNVVDNGSDDGGRAGIFTFKIPTGTGTFTVTNVDPRFCVYRVTGIPDMSTAFATAQTGGSGDINVNAPYRGCGFIVAVQNFGAVTSITGVDADLAYFPGNPGFGANKALSGGVQTYGGKSQLNIAATFQYDFF